MKKKIFIILVCVLILVVLGLIFLRKDKNNNIVIEDNNYSSKIEISCVVEIRGEVNRPGLYIVSGDARISDVIDLALGLTESADLSNINLASKVSDGMQIVVSSISEKEGISNNETNLININTATLQELMTIPKIGEAKAQAIINYRNTNGRFKEIEDIKKVSGISESLFEQIKEYITI